MPRIFDVRIIRLDLEGLVLGLVAVVGLYLCLCGLAIQYKWSWLPVMHMWPAAQGPLGALLCGAAYVHHVAIRNGKAFPFQQ